MRRLIAIIHPHNVASQRVAAKIGLEEEKCATVFGGPRVIYAAGTS